MGKDNEDTNTPEVLTEESIKKHLKEISDQEWNYDRGVLYLEIEKGSKEADLASAIEEKTSFEAIVVDDTTVQLQVNMENVLNRYTNVPTKEDYNNAVELISGKVERGEESEVVDDPDAETEALWKKFINAVTDTLGVGGITPHEERLAIQRVNAELVAEALGLSDSASQEEVLTTENVKDYIEKTTNVEWKEYPNNEKVISHDIGAEDKNVGDNISSGINTESKSTAIVAKSNPEYNAVHLTVDIGAVQDGDIFLPNSTQGRAIADIIDHNTLKETPTDDHDSPAPAARPKEEQVDHLESYELLRATADKKSEKEQVDYLETYEALAVTPGIASDAKEGGRLSKNDKYFLHEDQHDKNKITVVEVTGENLEKTAEDMNPVLKMEQKNKAFDGADRAVGDNGELTLTKGESSITIERTHVDGIAYDVSDTNSTNYRIAEIDNGSAKLKIENGTVELLNGAEVKDIVKGEVLFAEKNDSYKTIENGELVDISKEEYLQFKDGKEQEKQKDTSKEDEIVFDVDTVTTKWTDTVTGRDSSEKSTGRGI